MSDHRIFEGDAVGSEDPARDRATFSAEFHVREIPETDLLRRKQPGILEPTKMPSQEEATVHLDREIGELGLLDWHQTIVDPAYQNRIEIQRARRRQRHQVDVEQRPLSVYDALIA